MPWLHEDLTAITGAPIVGTFKLSGYGWGDYKQIVFCTADRHIHELYFSVAEGWQHADLTAITGAPLGETGAFMSLVGYAWGDYKQVIYLTSDGHVHELYASLADGWQHADLSALTGAPAAVNGSLNAYQWKEYKQVVFIGGDQHVHELYASPAVAWSHADLSVLAGAPIVYPARPAAYAWGDAKQVAAFSIVDAHLHELYATIEGGWRQADLTRVAGAPFHPFETLYFGVKGFAWNDFKQVVYCNYDGHVHELYASAVDGWNHADLSALTNAPYAIAWALDAYTWGDYKQVAYADSAGSIHELFASAADGWQHANLSVLAGNAPKAVTNGLCAFAWRNQKQVAYLTQDGHIHELHFES